MLSNINEIKVMILYLFSSIDEEMEKSIADGVVSATEMVNMLDYVGILDELVLLELIYKREKDGTVFFGITENGREVALEAEKLYLMKSEREKAIKAALRYYEAVKTGVRYYTDMEQTESGFTVHYKVTLNGKPVLETNAFFDNREAAINARNNCETRPQVISNNMMAVLTGDIGFMDL